MGYTENVVPGEVPEVGAIFMSNTGTKKECFRRKLFGLPSNMSNFVKQVKKGMVLFLFEFEKRQLFGVYQATSDGEIDIEPNAFKSSGKYFPAQVRFTQMWNCSPLAEPEFRNAIRDNYYSGKKFHFGLSENQVRKLMVLFRAKRIWKKHHPERHFWREVDTPAGKDRKFGDKADLVSDRDLISDRIGFVRDEDALDRRTYREFVDDEVKEEEGDGLYLNRDFVEKLNNSVYDEKKGNRNVMAERSPKDNTARILVDGDRQTTPLDHSLRWLRKGADADPYIRGDVNNEHNNFGGIAEMDYFFMMEKTKNEIDRIEDGHGREHIGVARSDGRFLMDDFANRSEQYADTGTLGKETCNRRYYMNNSSVQDEYHLGGPCNRDDKFFSHEIVEESEELTLTEHPMMEKQRKTADVGMLLYRHEIEPECDNKDFSFFGPVSPTTRNLRRYSSGEEANKSTADFFPYKQNTTGNHHPNFEDEELDPCEFPDMGRAYCSGSHDTATVTRPPYDPDILQLKPPSYFAVDNSLYRSSKEEEPCMRNKSLTYHTMENKGSMSRYKAADSPPRSSQSHHLAPFHETRDGGPVERYHQDNIGSMSRYKAAEAPPRSSQSHNHLVPFHEETRDGSPIERYHQENIGSMSRYKADEAPPRSSQSHNHLVPFHEETRDGSPIERYHQENKGSMSRYMADAPRSNQSHHHLVPFHEETRVGSPIKRYVHQENTGFKTSPFNQGRRINLNVNGTTKKRRSVFDRLSSSAPEPQEINDIADKEDDNLVDNVMEMLERVVKSSNHAIKQEDDDDEKHKSKVIEYDEKRSKKVKVVEDSNIAKLRMCEGRIESDGSILQEETRFVDFKRRRKKATNIDHSVVGKRRRLLVRPVPAGTKSSEEGISHGSRLVQETVENCGENVDTVSKGNGNGDNSPELDSSVGKRWKLLVRPENKSSAPQGIVSCHGNGLVQETVKSCLNVDDTVSEGNGNGDNSLEVDSSVGKGKDDTVICHGNVLVQEIVKSCLNVDDTVSEGNGNGDNSLEVDSSVGKGKDDTVICHGNVLVQEIVKSCLNVDDTVSEGNENGDNSLEVDSSVGKGRDDTVSCHGNALVQETVKSCLNVDDTVGEGNGNGDNFEVVLLAQGKDGREEEAQEERHITRSKDDDDENWCGWIEY